MANVNFVEKKLKASGIKRGAVQGILIISCCLFALGGFSAEIKQPNVAGAFYPDKPGELSALVDGFLEKSNPQPMEGRIFALISPHAGYGYSGQVAAYGYKLIKGNPYRVVVVIAPSHQFSFNGVSVYPEGIFKTPLGDLEVDSEFAKALLNKDPGIYFEPKAFAKEHSLEVQLPFLQRSLTDFKIVPIIMGDCSLSTCQGLADLLKAAIGKRKDVLLVASSDMYHGYDYQEAESTDSLTLGYLKNMDAPGLYYGLREGKLQMCGGFPAVTAITLAKELGHHQLKVLKSTNSALVTGNKDKGIWTVGYASCAIDQPEEGGKAMLNKNQEKRLLEIARSSIEAYLKTGARSEVSENDPALVKELGAFVTLHEQGQLRGCIGNLIGDKPLYIMVRDMAVESAVGDPRFTPVKISELKNIRIEISVLSPLQRVNSADEIQMGKHGVLVRQGYRSGVYLPQVATETGWSKEEFLSSLCSHKAGLSPDAWKDKNTEVYIFTALVFSEDER
jgi:AmmeMemoRadiSam system protein B/AmmeMemoRadiSam system protein A